MSFVTKLNRFLFSTLHSSSSFHSTDLLRQPEAFSEQQQVQHKAMASHTMLTTLVFQFKPGITPDWAGHGYKGRQTSSRIQIMCPTLEAFKMAAGLLR